MGNRGIGEALLTQLVSGVSRGEVAAQAVETSRPGVAVALRQAPSKIDFWGAARAGKHSNEALAWAGYQRGPRPSCASIARISPYAAIFSAGLQRGYAEQETASGAAAARLAANGVGGGLLCICGRRAAGRGDGATGRRASDWGARALSDGEALARGAAGVSYRFARRIAGPAGPPAQRTGMIPQGFAGAGEVAAGAATGGAAASGLKSVHLMTMRTGICWPFKSTVSSERE